MPDSIVRRVTWRTADVAQVLLLGTLFLFLWRFFWMVYTAIFIALIAVLLAIVLHAPAKFLSRWIPFRLGFAIVVALFLASIGGLLVAMVPQIMEQVSTLARQLPNAMNQAADWFASRTDVTRDGELMRSVNEQLGDFIGRFVPLAFNLITAIIGSTAIIILAVFLAYQPAVYRDLIIRMAPPASRPSIARVYDEAGAGLRTWVLGKAVTMVLVGLAVWIGLMLFRIPGALALGTLAAVLEFIPNLGPTIAAAPAVVAAFLISPETALWVAIFYFVLQQIQSALTVPLVEQRAVNIPPAALLIWQIMLAVGFGLLGLFVATPLLAIIVVAGRILYLEPSETRYASDRRETARPAKASEPRPDEAEVLEEIEAEERDAIDSVANQ
ncbi:MAG TPA: AI-2E family transporter [Longimicrobiaceae bacterium]|nr:AI-2E family transporter [Longimicrobiaceae bacterium]